MPQTPKPRVLPRVTYAPRGEESPQPAQNPPPVAPTGAGMFNPMNYYNPSMQNQPAPVQTGDMANAYPTTTQQNPFAQFPNGEQAWADYQAGKYANNEPASQAPQPTGMDSRQEDTADARAARIQQARASSINRQIDENTKATDAARASGDTEALARLQAEWERIAPMAQKYGISADRLVNSYMQPTNAAAKSDLRGALAAAIADDVWAEQATQAFGRPPNQLEWDEHWKAMNIGGRDPLEGHSQSIANIKARMDEIQRQNQQGQYGQYQQWLNGQ